jgi:hypothetical protein
MAELTQEAKLRIEKERQEKDKLKDFKPSGPKEPKPEKEQNIWAAFDSKIVYSSDDDDFVESGCSMTESEGDSVEIPDPAFIQSVNNKMKK